MTIAKIEVRKRRPSQNSNSTLDFFEDAQEKLGKIMRLVEPEDALVLYGFYRQATYGDCGESKTPQDSKAMMKWQQWKNLKGMSKDEAMKRYVQVVEEVSKKAQNSKL
jgi:diazepam-binding inhibitor (GABA receptor modulating acyl-CoA-binding protein)